MSGLTSLSGTSGGPEAMSAALVPGLILLRSWAPCFEGSAFAGPGAAGIPGDLGGNCTSGKGGGLGRRGELVGEAAPILVEAMDEYERD